MRANPHPTWFDHGFGDARVSFNPRVRANPHPTPCILLPQRVGFLFQSSSASEPAPDVISLLDIGDCITFQSSSASEPAPDMDSSREMTKLLFVSILECERTRTRPCLIRYSCLSLAFQSSSASEPAPDDSNSTTSSALEQSFNPRVRANPHPTAQLPNAIAI